MFLGESSVFNASFTFSQSSEFSESLTFSQSSEFSESSTFSPSLIFTSSRAFSPSSAFADSFYFTQSQKFSNSMQFSPSQPFPCDFSGSCGSYLKYTPLMSALTISGAGPMDNCTADSKSPWSENADSIKAVTIEEGVTTIGSFAFGPCPFMSTITIAQSVTPIHPFAFNKCESLRSIEIPEFVSKIEPGVSSGCSSLPTITIYGEIRETGDEAFFGCTLLERIFFITKSHSSSLIRSVKDGEPIRRSRVRLLGTAFDNRLFLCLQISHRLKNDLFAAAIN
ncbi:hypothetical protein M9Y10_029280 [Tritrichomonas musculus]|uniref:Surface antigen BspA-like n=1 Tax=Tritrichomonas musculus TaxID=1915356 RepID=A0ABR2KLM8_9EUKA